MARIDMTTKISTSVNPLRRGKRRMAWLQGLRRGLTHIGHKKGQIQNKFDYASRANGQRNPQRDKPALGAGRSDLAILPSLIRVDFQERYAAKMSLGSTLTRRR